MAESLSRLHNPRRPEPSMEEPPKNPEEEQSDGDHMRSAAESLHSAEPGSKHMVISHDGYSYRSHGIHEDGRHEPEEGAHDHDNIEALKEHMDKFFDEEAQEPKSEGMEPSESQSLY